MTGKYRVSGAMFENTKAGPAYTGFVEIDGVKTNIALWPKRSAKGQDYMQVAENKMLDKSGGTGVAPRAPAANSPFKARTAGSGFVPKSDMDDDIPFTPEFR